MPGIIEFQEEHPSLESYWRSIILFGRNVASYKFALAEALLDLAPTSKTVITLDELAEPYVKHLCEHLKTAPKQATSKKSRFISACREYNEGKITHDQFKLYLNYTHICGQFFCTPSPEKWTTCVRRTHAIGHGVRYEPSNVDTCVLHMVFSDQRRIS